MLIRCLLGTLTSAILLLSQQSNGGSGAWSFIRLLLETFSESPVAVQEVPAEPSAAGPDDPQQLLQSHLLKKCGACHNGATRVVPELDMSDFDGLLAKNYIVTGSPDKSKVWQRVTKREMPPPTWGTLAREDRDKLRQLIANLETGSDANGVAAPKQDAADIVTTGERDARLSRFVSWARQNKLIEEALKESGPFTILAPTNEAIVALGPENLRFLNENPEHLRTVLLNHGFIGSTTMAEMIRAGNVETTMSRLAVQKQSDHVWIGEAKVIEADIRCSNGIIHVIDKVQVPLRVSRKLPKPNPAVPNAPGGIQMVVLDGGPFLMGSPKDEEGRHYDEGPQHQVVLDPFLVSKYEITRRQYWGIMYQDPSDTNMPGRREIANDDPVQRVNWFEAVQFCNRLSELDAVEPYYELALDGRGENGKPTYRVEIPKPAAPGYRLLTEAEWEYACRAGSQDAYCFGDSVEMLPKYAWYQGSSEGQMTHPVGKLSPNAFGLYDMHGNVAEWCQDWYGAAYAQAGAALNPMGPSQGTKRVVRGASYLYGKDELRCAARHQSRQPWYFHRTIGLRVARYVPPELRPGVKRFADVHD